MDLESITSQIIQHPLFFKLKGVVENNGYHNQERVYDHLIKTKDIALEQIKGDFITEPDAKMMFLDFINADFEGIKRADVMVLIALLHDVGKLLSVQENNEIKPLIVTRSDGTTICPGHEYWGSTIVYNFLLDFNLPDELVEYISAIIRLHDTFGDIYWESKKDWTIEMILNDVKSRAEGLYKEALFNIYCDCFTATPFEVGRQMIVKVFNDPNLYTEREYVIT